MADKKISALTAATTPLAGTEVLPIVQSSATVKVSVANLTAGRDISVAKLTATDNIVIATAGKGIDFSATGDATGMTSELFSDYEEGTWTLNITAGTGSFGTVSGTGTYTRIGREIYIDYNILISGNGTAASYIKVAGLPYTASSYRGMGTGFETDAVGFSTVCQVIGSTNYFFIYKTDATYPGADGYRLQGSLIYRV